MPRLGARFPQLQEVPEAPLQKDQGISGILAAFLAVPNIVVNKLRPGWYAEAQDTRWVGYPMALPHAVMPSACQPIRHRRNSFIVATGEPWSIPRFSLPEGLNGLSFRGHKNVTPNSGGVSMQPKPRWPFALDAPAYGTTPRSIRVSGGQ